MTELHWLSALEAVKLIKNKKLSPVELTDALIKRIDKYDKHFNTFISLRPEQALKEARVAEEGVMKGDALGPLHGIPFGLKDIIDAKGWNTTAHSVLLKDNVADKDAFVTGKLKEAGAILLGKLSTHEFALGGPSFDLPWPPARNAWNRKYFPGGSSSGSGAAVAAGMAVVATGTDSGGSIRGPASFCGVVGFKPTFGRVPVWPQSPLMGMEHCGPIARSVRDAAIAFEVMAGGDSRDGSAIQRKAPKVTSGLERGIKDLRIGFSPDLGVPRVDDDVLKIVSEAKRVFASLGGIVSRTRLDLREARELSYAICNPMAARIRSDLGKKAARLSNKVLLTCANDGAKMSAVDYLEAEARRTELRGRMSAFYEKYDLLICPTLACAPFPVGHSQPPHWRKSDGEFMGMATPFDLTGQPAISLPCGFTDHGAPVGLQIVGPYGADALVLKAARAFEKAVKLEKVHPPI